MAFIYTSIGLSMFCQLISVSSSELIIMVSGYCSLLIIIVCAWSTNYLHYNKEKIKE